MLSDLPSLKTAARIQTADTSEDNYLTSLLLIADRAVKLWCKRDLETQPYVEYLNGSGTEAIALPQRPVWSVQRVNMDSKGFAGQGQGAFTGKDMVSGTDYMLSIDSPDGSSRSGLLYRLSIGFIGDVFAFPWDYYRRGSLTARLSPAWPRGYRNLLIAYTAGLGIGAAPPVAGTNPTGGTLPAGTTLPPELTHAVNAYALWLRSLMPVGTPLDTGTMNETAANVLSGKAPGGDTPEVSSVRALLRRYREVSLGTI